MTPVQQRIVSAALVLAFAGAPVAASACALWCPPTTGAMTSASGVALAADAVAACATQHPGMHATAAADASSTGASASSLVAGPRACCAIAATDASPGAPPERVAAGDTAHAVLPVPVFVVAPVLVAARLAPAPTSPPAWRPARPLVLRI